ncbi:Protein SHORTAGE IN CHIASMATA 1 [Camellia lanceoleosa]|uniref:Protein SHORTAGE IN CHIASMATA 1 n=1 Tax=Camellia lanceoleosa TaxID=1840588 RepID=A0ACC0IVS9_9ERIC|nr:Protein SHORTAGE IN CHIASMATA 1 [Camellia lanceoleosa]
MRTRFLSIDYFNSAPIHALQTLEFLRLPPPHLPPPFQTFEEEEEEEQHHHHLLRCFDDVPALSLSLHTDTLPIDNALSKFFSDVVPSFIHLQTGDFSNTHSSSGDARFDKRRNFSPRSNAEAKPPEEKNESIFYGKEENGFEVVEFELPELDLFLENACFFEEEKVRLFDAVGEADNNVDMLNLVLTLHHPIEILESFYSVDYITPEYCMGKKAFLLEDAHIPFLEVDEISLGIFSSISMEEEFLLLENIEPQVCPQRGEVIVDGKELLGSLDIDILEYLADHCLSKQCFESVPSCSNFCLETELISILELSFIEGNSAFHGGIPDDNSIWSVSTVNFEEFEFLDFDSYQFLEVFSNSVTVCEAETCEQMFLEDSNFRNFNELIVSHELTLVDESFKSLPIPILSENEKIRSSFVFVEEMLVALKPQPSSASDGIYLDWHFLEEDYRNCEKYSSCLKQVLEVNNYVLNSDMKCLNDGILILDIVFSGDTPNGANIEDNKETLNILSGGISTVSACLSDYASGKLLNDGCQKHGNGEVLSDINADRVSTLGESITPFNDLSFSLNPREVMTRGNSKPAVKAFDGNTMFPAVSSTDQIAPGATTIVQFQQWELKLHQVKLSDNILELIDNFQKNYLAILKSDIELTEIQHSCLDMSDTELLRLPTEKLMDCIKKANFQGTSLAHGDDSNGLVLVLLWHPYNDLYVDKLCRTLDWLKSKISFLQTIIEDMHGKAERDITASHPSLSVIQAILQSNINDYGLKVLIVAEQVFWWPLKRLLTSMQISYNEQQSFFTHSSKQDLCYNNEFIDTKADVLHSDCCLISNEGYSLQIYYSQFIPSLTFSKLEELLNFVPHKGKYDMGSSGAADDVKAFCMPLPVPCAPLTVEPKQIPTNMLCFPDTVIIVNTQNSDKEMIISRRSTYQRILAMEKQGVQIVERDLKLPVDVIISAAICLVWYDFRNVGKKATAPDAASSCLPLCIENIATNVLTSLSFAFSCCILVFEGERSFLSAVMESSDELYAAAASLRIDLQLFCSYSSELTEEIILSCIGRAFELTRHTYPKMPESETLGESFLTAFPSINPLSAHAILSSGGILGEFLEWSHERRIHEIQKYHVPDESVSLLSTLCRYGEREDSRSAMTDCSSSVSSATDSEHYYCKIDPVRKKGKYIESPQKFDIPMDDLFHFEQLKQFPDDSQNHLSVSNPRDTWISGAKDMFDEIEKPGVSFSDKLFTEKQGSGPSGVAAMMSPSKVRRQLDSRLSRGTVISNGIKQPGWSLDNMFFGTEEALDMAMMNKLDCGLNNNSANLWEDLKGEVIDIGDSFSEDNDFSSILNLVDLSCLVPVTDKDPAAGNFRTARKLSFSRSSLPTFPTAVEISSKSDVQVSSKDHGQSLREGTNIPHGGTTLSNAIHYAQPQQGSPWTVEFLNRIREKSRLRQQSLPHDMSPHCFAYSGNVSKVTKRKSPSILDFYKYQGGSTPRKIIERKRQRLSTEPSTSSKNEKTSTSSVRAWTPLDKRARRVLSFSTGGGGGQSKLVWSDRDAHTMDRRRFHHTA